MASAKRIGGSSPGRARALRHDSTEPERILWRALRNRQLGGFKFRRQTPVGRYIADFLCLDAMLIVEVDGDTHGSTQAQDARRTDYLESEGFRVIRFSNADVMANLEGVLTHILAVVREPSPSQTCGSGPSPSRWERG